MPAAIDLPAVQTYFLALQDRICRALEAEDGTGKFTEDNWTRDEGGGGRTRILTEGTVFEKAGVSFSHVHGTALPPSATARRPELAGRPWQALGISLVLHPRNPYVPIAHANLRFFLAGDDPATPQPVAQASNLPPTPPAATPHSSLDISHSVGASSDATTTTSWFGGGFDLTPCYGFAEDCIHWHRTARTAVAPFGDDLYPQWKKNCDDYFYLKHRAEPRGIGGLFFDDFNTPDFAQSFATVRAVGDAFLPAYLPIAARRKSMPFGQRERDWQLYRRGRYVEFNLVWDRGTHFGLQSGGRTESILMSLPPLVAFTYNRTSAPGSEEARLHTDFLKPRDWLPPENV